MGRPSAMLRARQARLRPCNTGAGAPAVAVTHAGPAVARAVAAIGRGTAAGGGAERAIATTHDGPVTPWPARRFINSRHGEETCALHSLDSRQRLPWHSQSAPPARCR